VVEDGGKALESTAEGGAPEVEDANVAVCGWGEVLTAPLVALAGGSEVSGVLARPAFLLRMLRLMGSTITVSVFRLVFLPGSFSTGLNSTDDALPLPSEAEGVMLPG